jgi:hypothetical protein
MIHTPTGRTIAAANSLVLVNCFEKLWGSVRIYLIFDRNEHSRPSSSILGPNTSGNTIALHLPIEPLKIKCSD